LGIKIVRFQKDEQIQWGVINDQTVIALENESETLADFLKLGIQEAKNKLEVNNGKMILLDEIDLLSPVTKPANIICQGVNYSQHRKESGLSSGRPAFNMIFSKLDSSLCGPFETIIQPDHVQLLDYEIELGLVIGKEITSEMQVTEDNLHDYVAGLVIGNDVSARDVQLTQLQWLKGKSYRTFCPVGPYFYVMDEDEYAYLYDLELELKVNDEVRQSANTDQLLFKPTETLTELSQLMELKPGDLLLTGTPGGVAMQLTSDEMNCLTSLVASYEEKQQVINRQLGLANYLKEGDLIETSIYSRNREIDLGTQRNVVRKMQYV